MIHSPAAPPTDRAERVHYQLAIAFVVVVAAACAAGAVKDLKDGNHVDMVIAVAAMIVAATIVEFLGGALGRRCPDRTSAHGDAPRA